MEGNHVTMMGQVKAVSENELIIDDGSGKNIECPPEFADIVEDIAVSKKSMKSLSNSKLIFRFRTTLNCKERSKMVKSRPSLSQRSTVLPVVYAPRH